MQHIVDKFLGVDPNHNHHYQTKCSLSIATPRALPKSANSEPSLVEVGNDGSLLCKVCEAAQYNIEGKIGSFLSGAGQTGFMRSKPDGDAVGKEESVVIDGYGIDGELSSNDGLKGYEQSF